MMFSRSRRRVTCNGLALLVAVIATILACPVPGFAQNATAPGTTRIYSTIYSIGAEWDISGDSNHDATVSVQYRVQGTSTWNQAMPLMRVDNGLQPNGFAGSIFFLNPDTTYEVTLNLFDADGGTDSRILTVATRPLPDLPTGGRTFHVVPGVGGGDGSPGNPFQGIAAAQIIAQPGDIFLVHAGTYGGRPAFTKSGTDRNYIVWRSAGDGEVLLSDGFDIGASHAWLEGVTVRNQPYAMFSKGCPHDVVLRRNSFLNNHYSIYLQQGGEGWYIADNTVVGDTPVASGSLEGAGILLNHGNLVSIRAGCPGSPNNTVAYNSVTNVADTLDNPGPNTDVFGNDFFDYSDDGLELDSAGPNFRAWGNRLSNGLHSLLSFQPQGGAPWYLIRNQLVASQEDMFKFRGKTDRFMLLHNTVVNWSTLIPCCINREDFLKATAKNNLFISVTGGEMWSQDNLAWKGWYSDIDYNGYDWGFYPTPFTYGALHYGDLASLAAASGLETHGIVVNHSNCFDTFNVSSPPPASVPSQFMTLKAGCNAIDAGVILPNINDGFLGSAPDLGAYEFGQPLPSYGPRPVSDVTPPSIAITSPSGGATVLGAVTVAATAWDDVGVVGVQFQVDGANLGAEATVAPYTLSWITPLVADGAHTLTALARDAAGSITTSSPVTVTVFNDGKSLAVIKAGAGSGTVTSPPPGINCGTNCSALFASGTSVVLTETPNSNSTFASWSGCDAVAGTQCTVVVTATRTVTATFQTIDSIPPTVSLTAPAAGATVAGAIAVAVAATDNVGVVGVQFKLDGAALGAEATTAPYAVAWNTATAANGSHTLTAAARDAAGNVGTAASVSVTVANDVTAPVISGVTASSVTSSGATIRWTTNEASNTQVEYGRTVAYGSVTPLNTNLVNSHSRVLSGLASKMLYHYRVKSRDSAGNLAVSGDFTFRTH